MPDMQTDLFNPPYPFWWWQLHQWTPTNGGVFMCTGLLRHPNGDRFAEIFRNGYLLEVSEYQQQAICYLPPIALAPWVEPVVGVVAFCDINPVTEVDFDEIAWRIEHPLTDPQQMIKTFRQEEAQYALSDMMSRQRAP
jgi:hypothetical protein